MQCDALDVEYDLKFIVAMLQWIICNESKRDIWTIAFRMT